MTGPTAVWICKCGMRTPDDADSIRQHIKSAHSSPARRSTTVAPTQSTHSVPPAVPNETPVDPLRLSGNRCPECGWVLIFGDEWDDDQYVKDAYEHCGQCGWESA